MGLFKEEINEAERLAKLQKQTRDKIKVRIATRRLLGMTADEYNKHEMILRQQLEHARQRAIQEAIAAGINGDDHRINRAIANCATLGLTQEKI